MQNPNSASHRRHQGEGVVREAIPRMLANRRNGAAARRLGLWLWLALTWMLPLGSAATNTSSPFLRLRETTLGYHGPAEDFTNLAEIRIGWFGPTNASDRLNGDLWWAASLAVEQANAARAEPGPGSPKFLTLPFRLIPRWSVDPWGAGVSQLARMIYDEQPLALIGSVDSASTHLAEQIAAKANLPLVSPVATDKSITLAGVSWMFSCAPSDTAIARVLVDDVLASMRPAGDRLALLTCTDHESRMTSREVLHEFGRRQRAPDFRFDVPPGATDLTQQMRALQQAKPAAVLVIAGPEDAARLVRAVRQSLPEAGAPGPTLFGSQAMGRRRFLELAGPAAVGVRFPWLLVPDRANPDAARFVTRFVEAHQRPPDYTAVLTYDATRLLLEAIRRAGPNRARIREVLAGLSPWTGLAGQVVFDGTGQNTRADIRMGIIRGDSAVALASVFGSSPPAETTPQP